MVKPEVFVVDEIKWKETMDVKTSGITGAKVSDVLIYRVMITMDKEESQTFMAIFPRFQEKKETFFRAKDNGYLMQDAKILQYAEGSGEILCNSNF
jgi:hypothetical protein